MIFCIIYFINSRLCIQPNCHCHFSSSSHPTPLQYNPNFYTLGLFSQQELTSMAVPLFEEEESELSSMLPLDCSIPCHSPTSPSAVDTALSDDVPGPSWLSTPLQPVFTGKRPANPKTPHSSPAKRWQWGTTWALMRDRCGTILSRLSCVSDDLNSNESCGTSLHQLICTQSVNQARHWPVYTYCPQCMTVKSVGLAWAMCLLTMHEA